MKTALSINQPFKDWVNHLKQDIRSAQIKAAVRVNSELLHLGNLCVHARTTAPSLFTAFDCAIALNL